MRISLKCIVASMMFFLLLEMFGVFSLIKHAVEAMYQNVNQSSEITFRSLTIQKPLWWFKEDDDENITIFSTVHYFNYQLKKVKMDWFKTDDFFAKGAFMAKKNFCVYGYSKQTISLDFQMLRNGQIEFKTSPVDVVFCQEELLSYANYVAFFHEASDSYIRVEPYILGDEQYYINLIKKLNILHDYDHMPEKIEVKRPNSDL